MTAFFKDDRNKFDKILEQIELMGNSAVLVGFQEGIVTKSQSKDNRQKKAGESLPEIAAKNEFGTSRIPARSFMRTSFDENQVRISKAISGEYDKIIEGKSTVKKSLGLIGLFMTDLIQKKIREIHYPPNAPYTIARKKSSKPLIDFGQMISGVQSKVIIK